jgi:HSP20 family protein
MPISHFRPGLSPWQALQQLREQMDSIIGSMFTGTPGEWSPPVDLEERDNEFVLTADLPGMRPEDIDIEIDGNTLTLRGEKREEREQRQEGERYFYERQYGNFVRRLTLPQSVDPDRARARFENGILHVTFPKREGRRGKRLQIEGGEGGH